MSRTRPKSPSTTVTPSEPSFSELMGLMSDIEKRHGAGVMRRGGDLGGLNHIDMGSFSLDYALLGGLAQGFGTMFYGWESSGKSTMAMRAAAGAQRKFPDRAIVYLDAEGTYDTTWATAHGVDKGKLFYVQSSSGEEAVDILQGVMSTDETALIIVDSLPAMVPMKEAESSAEDNHMALRSRLNAKLCANILFEWGESNKKGRRRATVVLINQFRSKVGFILGDPRTLPGGSQIKYLCSTMIELKNKEAIGKNSRGIEIVTHNDHGFVIKKSKAGNSIRTGAFCMIRDPEHRLGAGAIDEAEAVVAFGKKMGFHSGAGQAQYFSLFGDRKFTSGARIAEYLQDNPDELHRAKQMLLVAQRVSMGLPALPPDNYLLGEVDEDVLTLAQET